MLEMSFLPIHIGPREPAGLDALRGSVTDTKVDGGVSVCSGTITKHHSPDGFHDTYLLSPSSGGWKFEIKMSAGPVPSEGCEERICSRSPSWACRWPSFPCLFMSSSLCVRLCPDFHFLQVHQAYCPRAPPNDLILT